MVWLFVLISGRARVKIQHSSSGLRAAGLRLPFMGFDYGF